MAITTFLDIGVARASGLLGRYRGPKSHALGAGRSAVSGTTSSKHAPLTRSSSYSSKRLQFPFNVESDPHQGHYIVFDIKKYKPAKLEGLRTKQRTLEKALDGLKKELAIPPLLAEGIGGVQKELKDRIADTDNQLLENTNKLFAAEVAGEGIGSQGRGRGAKANSAISLKSNQTKSSKASIALYMPPSVTSSYKVNYGNPEIALHTELGLNAFEAFMADQGDFWSGLQAGAREAKGGLKEWGTKASLASIDKLLPGARVISQMATGQVITPRMELMFESVGRRAFTYTFIFIPKSEREAQEVEKIVYAFKEAMHPEVEDQATSFRSMKIPDTFDIKYMAGGGRNAFLNKISSCFLSSMDVQYGADRFTAYPPAKSRSGEFGSPPQKTQLTLNFSELDILTKKDIQDGF